MPGYNTLLNIACSATGRSKRMLSDTPKVLHLVLGVPVFGWVLDLLAQADAVQAPVAEGGLPPLRSQGLARVNRP
mgnify:CR=1 FL=1